MRKDIGMKAWVNISDKTYSYRSDIFYTKKPDLLFLYQFDKNGLYKTRNQYKLETIHSGALWC